MRKRNILGTLAAAAAIALTIACGAGSTPTGSPTAVPEGKPTATTILVEQSPTASASPAKVATTVTTFGDGMWQVPEEVKPGTYKTTVPADSFNCYYAVLKNFDSELDSILSNGNQGPGKQVIMSVTKAAKGVDVTGCGTWVKIK